MGIIHRGSKTYYYRSVWRNGRMVCEYVAAGDRARMLAATDEADRRQERAYQRRLRKQKRRLAERKRELAAKRKALAVRLREEREAFRREMDEAEAPVIALCGRVEAVFRAGMAAAGFRLHARGACRKQRKGTDMGDATATAGQVERGDRQAEGVGKPLVGAAGANMPAAGGVDDRADLERKIAHLMERAAAGDQGVIDRIHGALAADPVGVIKVFGGDPAERVLDALYGRAGRNPGVRIATAGRLKQLRADLEGQDPTPLERVLIERVLFCWLDANLCDREAESGLAAATAGAFDLKLGEFLDKRRDRAHRRFALAVKSLAVARRLAVPAMAGAGLSVSVEQRVSVEVQAPAGAAETGTGGGSGWWSWHVGGGR